MKKLLTGNEAVAASARIHGVKFASAYPGTPSTEILENLSKYKNDLYAEWAPNEKVALEASIGASYAGARALASMKHVGINVASDPLYTVAYTGVNGGLVVISADEPGLHSSQNEQDNRHTARHAHIPMFEPSNSSEAYEMIADAYNLSEEFDTPVLFRMTTRVCHSKSLVDISDTIEDIKIKPVVKDVTKYVAVPAHARNMKFKVLEREQALSDYSNNSKYNYAEYNDKKFGIIASGAAYEYAKEVFGDKASYYKVGFSYPLPLDEIAKFAANVDDIYIIEENDPIMETEIKASGIECHGKDVFPSAMEITPEVIRASFLAANPESDIAPISKSVAEDISGAVPRPPTLCAGCPHRGFFHELGKLKNVYFSGDIGCYTLGFAKPYQAIDSVFCMGASISAAHGANKIFQREKSDMRAIGIIGDSTFFHTGINSLTDVTYNNSNTITVILDNRITGMTGHQQNPGSGYSLSGEVTNIIDIETLVKALGIKHVKTIDPNDIKLVRETLKWALDIDEPSVIITRYPCVLKRITSDEMEEFKKPFSEKYIVNEDACIGCKICLRAGCPSIEMNNETKKSTINSSCMGCSVCSQMCPKNAIVKKEEK